MLTAAEIISLLDLHPHPEGGYYRETFRDPREVDGRSVGTAIYFLLTEGEILRKSPFSSKQDVGKGRAFSVNSENALS